MDPTYGWAKAGRPARTYIQQLYEDSGCSSEDLPEAMNDREKWRERVRDIRAVRTRKLDWPILPSKINSHCFPHTSALVSHGVFLIVIDLILWHINHCRLFNVKSCLYMYIWYIWFCLVGVYGISTIVGYLISNPVYTCIFDIYSFVWLGFMAYHPL